MIHVELRRRALAAEFMRARGYRFGIWPTNRLLTTTSMFSAAAKRGWATHRLRATRQEPCHRVSTCDTASAASVSATISASALADVKKTPSLNHPLTRAASPPT